MEWVLKAQNGSHRMDAVVCGIDPGLNVTGYALLDAGRSLAILDAGVFRFDRKLTLAARLVALDQDIRSVFMERKPDIVAVEQLFAHYKHPRTAILMGHARGVILLAAARLAIEVRSYPSTRVKRYLTGNGHASKLQVQRAVQTTLGLGELPEPTDLADALAIAMCCAAEMANVLTAGPAR